MTQTSPKKFPKIYIFGAVALFLPLFLIGMLFIAAKSDAETKREYDQIRQQHAEKVELKKQQQKLEQENKQQITPTQKNAEES